MLVQLVMDRLLLQDKLEDYMCLLIQINGIYEWHAEQMKTCIGRPSMGVIKNVVILQSKYVWYGNG